MKITAKQYALSLYESLDGKPAGQVKAVVKNFTELLAKQGRLGQEKKIIEEFGKIWNEKHGIQEAEAASALKLDKDLAKALEYYIVKLTGARQAVIKEKIDKSLLGGVVIRYGDKVVDGSLKTALGKLREQIIK